MSEKELSPLARQLLGNNGHVKFYTQQEFDDSLAIAKAEIMTVAIQTTKTALMIEREACSEMAREAGHEDLAEAILNRIPSQRQ
jgi:hypothetical protein